MAEFRLRDARPTDAAQIRDVIYRVLEEFDLLPDAEAAEPTDFAASCMDRGGVFRVLVSPHGAIVGCGGLFPLDTEQAEIRKMYLLPAARGRGLGRILLADLIAAARSRAYRRVVLETASTLTAAIALYTASGFVRAGRAAAAGRCDQVFVLDLTKPSDQ